MKLFLLVLLLLTGAGARAAGYRHVDLVHSQIRFVSKQMGVPVDGVFRTFDVSLSFDPQAPATAHGQLRIALASIDTGLPEANEEVQGVEWFDARRFPIAQFELRQIQPLGAGRFRVSGMLSLKGVSRPLALDATLRSDGASQAVMDGTFVLKRLDFGVGGGVWGDASVVANEVTLQFHLVLEP